jgi:hypothetical protein
MAVPGDTRVWTQGLHFEPLHQPFFCGGFFWDRASQITGFWSVPPE